MCIRFPSGDSDSDWEPPPEPERIVEAREALLRDLEEVGSRIPGDGWVMGQRVAYLGEAEAWDRAVEVASDCELAPGEQWWCRALEGKALHGLGRVTEAEEAFDAALAGMPEEERREWSDLEKLVEPDLHRLFRDADGDSLAALEVRLWTLANPLFLVPGNDRRTEHFARHTLARIRSDARTPYAMSWGSDLAEVLVRYGPEAAYEREPPRPLLMGPQTVMGRFEPHGRRFLPEEDAFLDPVSVLPGQWRTDERRARSRHAPPFTPRIGGLDVEQVLLRRGDELLVVLDWRLADGPPDWRDGEPAGLRTGLFLLREEDLAPTDPATHFERTESEGGVPRGLATARVPAGGYLVSLEVLDPEGERAWRSRHGARQDSIPRGVVALSDLVLLEPDSASADDGEPSCSGPLESQLHRLIPGGRPDGRVVEVAWEVYGLEGEDGPLGFRLSAEREGRGLLRRAGEFFGLVDRDSPTEIRWEEGISPDGDRSADDPVLRCVALDLSSLPEGTARLTLSLELPGRTETRVERIVELPDV